MNLSSQELLALRRKLAAARLLPEHQCVQPRLGMDGLPFRLEPKPKGRRHVLEKYHPGKVSVVGGVLCVEVSNGSHDADFLEIDPETGAIACRLCREGAK